MPIEWTRDDQTQCFVGRVSGVLTSKDVIGVPPLRSGEFRSYSLLFQMDDAQIALSAGEVGTVAARVAKNFHNAARGPVAIVATNPAGFGMARMYQMLMESGGVENVRVFSDVAAARMWLDDPGDSPQLKS